MVEIANMHDDRTGGIRRRARINPPVAHFSEHFNPKVEPPEPFKISELGKRALEKGFLDGDTFQAEVVLGRIGYQHASSYFDLFKTIKGEVEPGASMKQLHRAVIFDRKLQALLLEYIGLFELQFRAQYSYFMSNERGAFAHRNSRNFKNEDYFKRFLSSYQREFNRQLKSNNMDLLRAYETYGDAPIWLAVEIMSFGTLSKLFNNTRSKAVRKGVASTFIAAPDEIDSWMRAISAIRNTCAHFGRVCGRKLIARPKKAPGVVGDNSDVFYIILLLIYLLQERNVFDDAPAVSYGLMMLRDTMQLLVDFEDLLPLVKIPEDWVNQLFSAHQITREANLVGDSAFIKRDGAGYVWFDIIDDLGVVTKIQRNGL